MGGSRRLSISEIADMKHTLYTDGYERGNKDGYKQGLLTALGILKTSEWPQMYVYIEEIEKVLAGLDRDA